MLTSSVFFLDQPQKAGQDDQIDKASILNPDIRQRVVTKLWLYAMQENLISGETEAEKEASFRTLLDSEEFQPIIHTIKKHELSAFYRQNRVTESGIKRLHSAEVALQRLVPPDNPTMLKRYMSLEVMMERWDFDVEDKSWEDVFESIEDFSVSYDACEKLQDIVENGTEDEIGALMLMRDIQRRKELGLPTSTDSIRSLLKRYRAKTGWALKPSLLN